MANILKVVVDEIRQTIKQTFDDKEVSRAQVAYWVIIVGNKLLGKHISNRDSGAYLVPYKVSIQQESDGRKFIELPAIIFDFDRDGGVEYMSFYNPSPDCKPEYRYRIFQRTTTTQLQWLELSEKTKPSPKDPYFWRAGEKLILEGVETTPVKQVEIGVYQMISPVDKIDLDAPFNFPDELLESLKRTVTDLARFSFLFPSDKQNDGKDTASEPAGKTIPKIASVNQQENG